MISTMTSPATSTNVITMFITTDSVMPMKLTITKHSRKSRDTNSAGGASHSVAK
jgi:hypothetical protein